MSFLGNLKIRYTTAVEADNSGWGFNYSTTPSDVLSCGDLTSLDRVGSASRGSHSRLDEIIQLVIFSGAGENSGVNSLSLPL